jgi:hypothetical protein
MRAVGSPWILFMIKIPLKKCGLLTLPLGKSGNDRANLS